MWKPTIAPEDMIHNNKKIMNKNAQHTLGHVEENYKEAIEQAANRLCGLSCGTAVDAVLEYVKRPDCSKAQTKRLISELKKLQ